MSTRIVLATAAALAFAGGAMAAPATTRVRGTIASVTTDRIVISEADGSSVALALNDATKYAGVVKSSLSAIEKGDFVGTATKGPSDFMVALELVIFPASMKGAGEGQYPWDRLPDDTAGGSGATASTMTNGTVRTRMAAPATTGSTMTNGTVGAASASGGAVTLTIDYGHGGSSKVIVPPTASVVRFRAGDRSLAVAGGKVFAVATGAAGAYVARFVAVGQDGTTPPM